MNPWIITSVVLALALYLPLCYQIINGKVKQNLATWILWSSLDGVCAATIWAQAGNYQLVLAYTLGGLITTFCILKSGEAKWTWFESFITGMVFGCVIIWVLAGSRLASIAGTSAMIIAGIPQLLESYRKPWGSPILIFLGYTIANGLSVVGAKGWTIEERFYPGSACLFCATLTIFATQKLWLKPPQTQTI